MTKVLVLGDQGTGKSTIALVMARSLMKIDKEIILYTNMNITGDRIKVINDFGEIPMNDKKNKILVIDELMFSLDARESSSKHNRAVTRHVAFYRKADIILAIFMTHELGMVDVRLRDQLQYLILGRSTPITAPYFQYMLYEKSTKLTTSLMLPKNKEVFDFADFDTKDHPQSLSSDILQLNPIYAPKK